MRLGVSVLEAVPYIRWLSLSGSVEEFAGIMQQQLDLSIEAQNLERFCQNFAGSRQVSFPRPINPFVSPDVLVETFEQGTPIGDLIAGKAFNLDSYKPVPHP